MTFALVYATIGIANTALLFKCLGHMKPADWLWLPVLALAWPLVVMVGIYVALSDSGR